MHGNVVVVKAIESIYLRQGAGVAAVQFYDAVERSLMCLFTVDLGSTLLL